MKHTPGLCLELTKGIPNQGSLRSAGWTGGAGIISTKAHSGALAESGSRPSGPENFRPGKAPAAGARLGCCLPERGVAQTPQIYRLEQKPPTKFRKKGVVFRIASKTFRFGTPRGQKFKFVIFGMPPQTNPTEIGPTRGVKKRPFHFTRILGGLHCLCLPGPRRHF